MNRNRRISRRRFLRASVSTAALAGLVDTLAFRPRLAGPLAIAIKRDGTRVYVADWYEHRVRVIDAGTLATLADYRPWQVSLFDARSWRPITREGFMQRATLDVPVERGAA